MTTTDERITVAIYGQVSALAGEWCRDPEAHYGEEWREADDLDVHEGTREELLELCAEYERLAKLTTTPAGLDLHFARSAASIREAIE